MELQIQQKYASIIPAAAFFVHIGLNEMPLCHPVDLTR